MVPCGSAMAAFCVNIDDGAALEVRLSAANPDEATKFELTCEQLAEMLGVGRTFVTRAVSRLREDGLIATRRGKVIIEDERALRERSCSCATSIESHFGAMLGGPCPNALG